MHSHICSCLGSLTLAATVVCLLISEAMLGLYLKMTFVVLNKAKAEKAMRADLALSIKDCMMVCSVVRVDLSKEKH